MKTANRKPKLAKLNWRMALCFLFGVHGPWRELVHERRCKTCRARFERRTGKRIVDQPKCAKTGCTGLHYCIHCGGDVR
jgi:predicted secreted Zn-dependent protease